MMAPIFDLLAHYKEMTDKAYARLAPALTARAPTRTLTLKGIAYPVQAHVLIAVDK